MKYRVIYEYRARVVVDDIEANDEKAAEAAGMAEGDDGIQGALELYDVTVKPMPTK